MTNADILHKIKNDDKAAMRYIYLENREQCLVFIQKTIKEHALTHQVDAEDIYQEAIAAFYMKVKTGQLTELWSKASTYLLAVSKNMCLNLSKKAHRKPPPLVINDKDELAIENLRIKVRLSIRKLHEPCKSFITLRYFDKLSMTNIAEITEYKNGTTVSNLISRCRKKFKSLFKKEKDALNDFGKFI